MSQKSAAIRDVGYLVVGLGGMGSAALYHLARLGAAPLGIEQFPPLHELGSSHGESRAFRILYHDRLYTQLAEAAVPLWQELEDRSGQPLLQLNGFLAFAKKENPELENRVAVAQQCNAELELLSADKVSRRFPSLRIPGDWLACFTPRAGYLNPRRAVGAHLEQATRHGAEIIANTQVCQVDLQGKRPQVITEDRTYRAEKLILTAGPWSTEGMLDLPIKVTRQQWFNFKPDLPSLFGPEQVPVFVDLETQYYGFPLNGGVIKVADDTDGDLTNPHSIDRTWDAPGRDSLANWLQTLMNGSTFSFVDGSTCMYSTTPDRDFLIGVDPRHLDVVVAAGFSGHGFKFSTLVGRVLAELATQGETAYPIERFRLDRFSDGRGDTDKRG